ncbi:MAG: ABC transporter substrate-binding protein [Prevotella sp.]|nr:ABC transporter substrate-binding protein [Prevotella sp.]MDY4037911.1 ABC transporter substrate-binding protein [Prevotella sp.]
MSGKIGLGWLVSLFVLASCSVRTAKTDAVQGDTVTFRYAEHIAMVRYKGYTKVTLADPWKSGRVLHTYLLVPKKAPLPPHLPKGTVVRTPLRRTVVFPTAHCQLLYTIGAPEAISGVADLKYILIPDIHRRCALKTGPMKVTDCGDAMAPMIEKIIETRPDAMIVSPFENSGGYGKIEQIGVPVIEAADYMETSALGRAEWMRFYGLLFGREQAADSLFGVVDSTYRVLKRIAMKLPRGRSILTERKTGSVWYCPGGRSTIGQLIADANGAYAFADDRSSGSLALSFEQVLNKAGETNVWAFKYNGKRPLSRRDLLAEFHGYASLKAFRTGEIYECNCSEVPFFEEVGFRPDRLLREFILLTHPGAELGKLRYFSKLNE